ncbi:50S ribosomal protein L11 methyltransferase [Thalassolituus marinus]|jgi:ribosomal protein L11 methyltransferase|uniref:Ribosomal protein L11 methyltransferase n=1 Tax=Thalassolituus marinus TaxID=671053 RepID=A0ABS7ZUR0_9GAMM|nr:50S ribosomal protein L11 methyltransferase [Thalassolituus marinus]MCA6065497.1 50S ribosomal protein L11 methyltransferase [Thalassolituus marinus]
MSWIQIRFHTSRDQVETTENALLGAGALSVTLQDDADQPILEPELGTTPIWDNTQVIGLFDANQNVDELLQQITLMYAVEGGSELPAHKTEIVEDKDWVRAWMEDYHPMQFGERLWVCPSWREPPQADAVNLMLDPGLAFGTGTHPTTALCLKFLDREVEGNELVVDYGCGSGILGIAALLLGARHMVGVDIDPQALTATRDNAGRNSIGDDKYEIYLPDATPPTQADIMVANILAGPLMSLGEHIASLTRSGGKLALSGLLAEQAEEVSACYGQWFEMNAPEQQGDWVVLTGVKR